jgi:hypothetical protein
LDDPKDGQNTIAFIDYYSLIKPTINDIINNPLLRHDYSDWPNNFAVKLLLARSMTKHLKKVELLGSYKISNYAENFLNTVFKHIPIYDFWSWNETDSMLINQYDFNINRKKDYDQITIKQLVSPDCDNYWYRLKGFDDKIKK